MQLLWVWVIHIANFLITLVNTIIKSDSNINRSPDLRCHHLHNKTWSFLYYISIAIMLVLMKSNIKILRSSDSISLRWQIFLNSHMLSLRFLMTFMLVVTFVDGAAGVLLPTKLWEIISDFATDLRGHIFCLQRAKCIFFTMICNSPLQIGFCKYATFIHVKLLKHLRLLKLETPL